MIDKSQIALCWKIFHKENLPTEIRMINGKQTASGYYMNLENVIRDVEYYDARGGWQMYFILNDINAACYDKPQHEKIIERPSSTTQASDIIARRWVFIDLDPKRTKDVSSTDEQLNAAKQKANEIYKFLKQQGFGSIIVAQSGNGCHLLAPCALKNNESTDVIISDFMAVIQMLFEDETIEIDQKTKDPSRLCKLYGTMAKKGADTPDRPHRMSRIVKMPDEIVPNDKSYFEKVAAMLPKPEPKYYSSNNNFDEKFDLETFLSKHGVGYKTVKTSFGTRYLLDECPFNSDHKHGDAMIFQYDTGAIEFSCFHNGCSQYHWRDFRLHFEPDAYDKKDYKEFQSKRKYYEKYVEPEPLKEENEQDGKKWLSFDDIKTVRDEDLVAIPSGIYALDKAIKGFILGEVTMLSGINASGKTSFLNTLALNAIQKGFNVALWSGELQSFRLKSWIAQTAAGKMNVSKVPGSDYAYETNANIIPKIGEWLQGKLFIYNNNYGSVSDQLIQDITECIDKNKTRFIILDNLMAISLDSKAGDKNDKQKQLILELSELAKKKDVHILLVAHPRKEANFTLLRKESISGTSDLTNVVQNLLLIHRVGDDFEKRATDFWGADRVKRLIMEGYNNIIEVAKNRSYGVVDMVVGMYYEIETRRFKNTKSEQIHYDWEESRETYTKPTMQPNVHFYNEPEEKPWRCDEPPF